MSLSKVTELVSDDISDSSENDNNDINDAADAVSDDTIDTIDCSRSTSPVYQQLLLTFNPNASEEEFLVNAGEAAQRRRSVEIVRHVGCIIALHLGAGYHSRINEGRHRKLGKR
jgi:hypothetical protein